jgi:hypothetical protein
MALPRVTPDLVVFDAFFVYRSVQFMDLSGFVADVNLEVF